MRKAYHVSNVPPEKMEGGIGAKKTSGLTVNQLLSDDIVPKNSVYVSKKANYSKGMNWIYEINIEGLETYPDYPSLIDHGAYFEDGFIWWKNKPSNKLLADFVSNFEDMTLRFEDITGEDTWNTIGSMVVSGPIPMDRVIKARKRKTLKILEINSKETFSDIDPYEISTGVPVKGFLYHGSKKDDIQVLEPRSPQYYGGLGSGLYLANIEEAANYGHYIYRVPIELKNPYVLEHSQMIYDHEISYELIHVLSLKGMTFNDWYEKESRSPEFENPKGSDITDSLKIKNGTYEAPKDFVKWVMDKDGLKKNLKLLHDYLESNNKPSREQYTKSYNFLDDLWTSWPENKVPSISMDSILNGETVYPFWYVLNGEVRGVFDSGDMEEIASNVQDAGYDSLVAYGLRQGSSSFDGHEIVFFDSVNPDVYYYRNKEYKVMSETVAGKPVTETLGDENLMVGYHCKGGSIRSNYSPWISQEYALSWAEAIISKLAEAKVPGASKFVEKFEKADKDNFKKYERLCDEAVEFANENGWAIIFVSPDNPKKEYGDNCFKVYMPRNSHYFEMDDVNDTSGVAILYDISKPGPVFVGEDVQNESVYKVMHITSKEDAGKIKEKGFTLKYFGRTSKIIGFNPSKNDPKGVFFTSPSDGPHSHPYKHGEAGEPIIASIKLSNPYVFEDVHKDDMYWSTYLAEKKYGTPKKPVTGYKLTLAMQKDGYDGVIVKSNGEPLSFLVFDIENISEIINEANYGFSQDPKHKIITEYIYNGWMNCLKKINERAYVNDLDNEKILELLKKEPRLFIDFVESNAVKIDSEIVVMIFGVRIRKNDDNNPITSADVMLMKKNKRQTPFETMGFSLYVSPDFSIKKIMRDTSNIKIAASHEAAHAMQQLRSSSIKPSKNYLRDNLEVQAFAASIIEEISQLSSMSENKKMSISQLLQKSKQWTILNSGFDHKDRSKILSKVSEWWKKKNEINEGLKSKIAAGIGAGMLVAAGGAGISKYNQYKNDKEIESHMIDYKKQREDSVSRIIDARKKELENSRAEQEKQAEPPAPASTSPPVWSADFIEFVKNVENNKNNPNGGYNQEDGRWYPHESAESGTKTIAYGHKFSSSSEERRYRNGLTDSEAHALLLKDLDKGWRTARSNLSDMIHVELGSLSIRQQEMLSEFAFNIGNINGFPKFTRAVAAKDLATARKEYERNYVDGKTGERLPLERRNKLFYERYLRDERSAGFL
jgi:GH24 family phage-related lysozyme (muramidase)